MTTLNQINEETINKYKQAGRIASKTIDTLVKNSKEGCMTDHLIALGTLFATEQLKNIKCDNKGFAFPITIGVNEIVARGQNTTLKNGDLVKFELGIHIDGFNSMIAYTTLIGETMQGSPQAKVLAACIEACKEVKKQMIPDINNTEIMHTVQKIAKKYDCELPVFNEQGVCPGIMSRQISQHVIDGKDDDEECDDVHRFIVNKENENMELMMRTTPLEENEVYAIDIVMCSGYGKLQSIGCNYYRRNYDNRVGLKLNASKNVLKTLQIYPTKVDQTTGSTKIGLKECCEKNLTIKYPTVTEKQGEYTARLMFTVVVKKQNILICGKNAENELTKIKIS